MKALHTLEIATVFISSQSTCSLSSVLPVIHGVVGQLEAIEDDSAAIREFKCIVISALKRKWGLEEINTEQIYVLSTFLDPRF